MNDIRKAAEIGARKILEFFEAPKDTRDVESARIGVQAGANYARIYAAETNRLAVALAMGRSLNRSSEDQLLPLLEGVAERSLIAALGRERSDDELNGGDANQSLSEAVTSPRRGRSRTAT